MADTLSPPRKPDLLTHEDGLSRCAWPGLDPFYVAYHDTEWGVPEYDSRALYEKLILDGFQAGLSWITILRRRDGFRDAFADFEPQIIAGFGPDKVEALMQDTRIIRNRSKIEGAIKSARSYLAIEERQGFSDFLWRFLDGRPQQPNYRTRAEVPVESDISKKMSKALKTEGFTFCGPTIVYAFMEATGMVNDHLTGCFRHAECAALGERR